MAYGFRKVIFIGESLKHVHISYFSWRFEILLIMFCRYSLFGVYFSPHQRNIVCEYKLRGKPIKKLFHFFLIFMLKKPVSFKKIIMNNFWFFSVSWTHFQKQLLADVLQNSSLWKFCNFLLIYWWICLFQKSSSKYWDSDSMSYTFLSIGSLVFSVLWEVFLTKTNTSNYS